MTTCSPAAVASAERNRVLRARVGPCFRVVLLDFAWALVDAERPASAVAPRRHPEGRFMSRLPSLGCSSRRDQRSIMMIAVPTCRFTRSRSGNESGEKVGAASGATVAVAAGACPGRRGKSREPRT